MGIVLDSSIIIAAERRGRTVREILEQVKATQGEIEIGVSVVTIAELVHGALASCHFKRLSSDSFVSPRAGASGMIETTPTRVRIKASDS